MENTNCIICLANETEIKCKYCSVLFHHKCFKEYNKIECPQCKNNLPEFLIDDKLKYKQCIKNMIKYFNPNSKMPAMEELIYKLFVNNTVLTKGYNIFDLKTFLNIFYDNNCSCLYIDNFTQLSNDKIFEYFIFEKIINKNSIRCISNLESYMSSFDIDKVLYNLISSLLQLIMKKYYK